MIERLLDRLYRAFDRDAAQVLALRLSVPGGLHWSVVARVLTLKTEAGALIGVIDLAGKTISEVADLMPGLGVSVVFESAEIGHRAADSLLSGEGRESESNGDHLFAFDSLLWSLLDAYGVELEFAQKHAIEEGVKQVYLNSAEAAWLDYWGVHFGIPRLSLETDPHYLVRIVREVLRLRSTAGAIANACDDNAGTTVEVREPWREIFVLDDKALDADVHFYDANFWAPNVFQLKWLEYVTLSTVQQAVVVAQRNRPVGSLLVRAGETPKERDIAAGWIMDSAVLERDGMLRVAMDLNAAVIAELCVVLTRAGDVMWPSLPYFWDTRTWGSEDWGAGTFWEIAVSLVAP